MDNTLGEKFVALISGTNGSGKTYLIKYLLKCIKYRYEYIIIFSNTASFNDDFDNVVEKQKLMVYGVEDFDKKLERFMLYQKKTNSQNRTLIIFDDIAGSIKTSKQFTVLISQQRHFNCSCIFSIQYIAMAATYLRAISRFIIIFKQYTKNSLKLAYENYFYNIETYEEFKKFFQNALKQYEFFFIDRKTNITKKMKIGN